MNIIISLSIVLLLDYYIINTYKNFFKNIPPKKFTIIYIAVTLFIWSGIIISIFFKINEIIRTVFILLNFIQQFTKILLLPFLIANSISIYLSKRKSKTNQIPNSENTITRSDFILKSSLIAGTIPLAGMSFGILKGIHDFQVIKTDLVLPNLPKEFEGMTVAQLSDIHSGSFFDKKSVNGGIDLLLNQKPDMIFITGDIVNEQTSEIIDYIPIFKRIKADYGVFSILGNHDYGDYKTWNSIEAKAKNLKDLIDIQEKEFGWKLLLNENELITLNHESLAIIGVENYGKGRFAKYGKLDVATQNIDESKVKLLLSHDPSHWRMQVLPDYKDIDIMFAGHTHGMQFGVRTKYLQWSPSQYLYSEWAGLYKEGNQSLYVNTGFGFLGMPARIGIAPEISIFKLTRG